MFAANLKALINGRLRQFGYEINNLSHRLESKSGWEQYKIVKADGSFDYDEYRRIQIAKSKRDIE